ncbi:hypothetical protein AFK24_13540 [Pseudomonas syringae]|uniref:Uncharacterized protein n=1 Tax=Pseudomonas syringae TaxID=317 RepID=A0A1C7Z7Y3_PSESX|nr:hypothetical protein AFK24_13540 [Pseudomonas syringae]
MMLAFTSFLLLMPAQQVFQMAAPAYRILSSPETSGSGGIQDLFDLPTYFVSRPRFGRPKWLQCLDQVFGLDLVG